MTNSYPSGSPGVPDSSMPTGAPGFTPRRSSYASVVSGTASASAHSYLQPARSGAFAHLLNPNSDLSYDPIYQNPGGHLRHESRAYDMDFGTNGGLHGRPGSWSRSGQLPSFSHAFSAIMNGNGYPGLGHGDHFFVPSYLKGSKYVQKLEESHKARVQAQKEDPQAQSSQNGSLSTSASSLNLHTAKLATSHRGINYEVIEKAPPVEDEAVPRLPSKWSSMDKYGGLEILSDGQEIKFTGPKSDRDRDHEACAVRADFPMPTQCGIYYYEVTIISRKREEYAMPPQNDEVLESNNSSRSSIGIGFSSKNVPLSRLPGWEPESWAYHGDDGHSFGCQSSGKHYGPPFAATDVIGCGINFRTGSAFFTKNGDYLGTAFRELKNTPKLFPSVGMKKAGEHVRVNFGQTPFVFDIDGMMAVSSILCAFRPSSKNNLEDHFLSYGHTEASYAIFSSAYGAYRRAETNPDRNRGNKLIYVFSTSKLAPPLSETELIQSLVLQYLTYNGHTETAKAFADEVYAEKKALTLDPNEEVQGFDVKEDEDAGHRQRIRKAVGEGDIEKALKHTNAFYPQVLKDNEHVYFRLRIRKFIEMIRQGAEMQRMSNGTNKSNGHGPEYYDDFVHQDMELDDQQGQNTNWDRMDTDQPVVENQEYIRLVSETLLYGQALQAEFKDDPRREVRKALEDAFALIAYSDPLGVESVSHLLDISGREAVADELNSAILLSLGKSSSTALEQLYQQTSVLLDDLRDGGGPGAFVNIDDYVKVP
ncbi:Uncharacterized protein LSUE1_G007172 [Lachnellula suecica]|uniref:Protein SSH4 n=1 Tax=Lachnellula suecica TaxID=602035 RepID=A0A8T9BXR5_9HELO|nr:Uncharacterized protein LSUE1_G007172 [Lachnellula suecica]